MDIKMGFQMDHYLVSTMVLELVFSKDFYLVRMMAQLMDPLTVFPMVEHSALMWELRMAMKRE